MLHDVFGGHQAYIHRFMAHRILHLVKTTRGSRDKRALRARRDYKLASLGAFGRSLSEKNAKLRLSFRFSNFFLFLPRIMALR